MAAALAGESALDNKRYAAACDLEFVSHQPPRDGLNHAVLDLLIAQPQHRDIRTWLADLVHDAAERLERSAAMKSLARPRMLSTQTFLHAHVSDRVLDNIDQWAGNANGAPSHRVPAPLLRVLLGSAPVNSAGVSLS